MKCVSDKTGANQGRWNPASAFFALVIVMLVGVADLGAQPQTFVTDNALQFIGNWTRDTSISRGNCGKYTDARGNPLDDCAIPTDKLELIMNDRARAWLEYFDELQSPTLNECSAITTPNLLGDVRPFGISFKTDRVIINYEQMNIIKEVWMDGRGHPPVTDLFQQGHAIGRWEGRTLVIETANFTFDPDGLDDHLHFPSSVRKKVTERYTLLNPDLIRIDITYEDPVFLTQPFVYFHQWKRSNRPLVGWWECDPDITRSEMELTAPVKYPGSVTGRQN
jgi:hypothetical protein